MLLCPTNKINDIAFTDFTPLQVSDIFRLYKCVIAYDAKVY